MTTSSQGLLPASMSRCICIGDQKPCSLCCGVLCLRDNKIQVCLKPKAGEYAESLALDGCLYSAKDKYPRCDGLFVLSARGQAFVLLVELKGSHVEEAFEQLRYTKNDRHEYQAILTHLRQSISGTVAIRQLQFIVSNSIVDARTKQKLVKAYGIRPTICLHGKPTLPAPDLRQQI